MYDKVQLIVGLVGYSPRDIAPRRGEACILYPKDNRCILRYACPKCSKVRDLIITFTGESAGWQIVDGTNSDPTTWTLAPSIQNLDCCDWHGHLIKGVWIKCT
ncbi:MAG TPA: hypothetical protein VL854_06960 [Nitrososphaeraceae archaeon]|nr:hypothetical protein [Nitrososphaeraceae archaeon]